MAQKRKPVITRLVLLGLRASGKTTLGKLMAREAGVPFVDLDDRIAARFGRPTAGIALRDNGAKKFRQTELEALKQAMNEPLPGVLALGGGTPTAPGAEDLLREAGENNEATLVYIRLTPETLAERLAADKGHRPALKGKDNIKEIPAIFKERDPLYQELAEIVINADEADEEDMCDALGEVWR